MASLKPKIAVALAVYNGKRWLSEQVESILQQNAVDVNVFISIDPSNDGSEELCGEMARSDKRIHVLPNVGRFGGAAPNFFRLLLDIDMTRFEYLSFADQDDIWSLEKLRRAVEILDNTNADGYSSNVIAFWSSGKKKIIRKSQRQRQWDFLFEAAGPGCTYVMTKCLTKNIQQNLRDNSEKVLHIGLHDWYCYAYARANGFRWVIDEKPSLLYRQHEGNQVGVNQGIRAFRNRVGKISGGWAIRQAALIAEVVGLKDNHFVQKWVHMKRAGFIVLSCNAFECRRRSIDRFWFFCACWIMILLAPKQSKIK